MCRSLRLPGSPQCRWWCQNCQSTDSRHLGVKRNINESRFYFKMSDKPPRGKDRKFTVILLMNQLQNIWAAILKNTYARILIIIWQLNPNGILICYLPVLLATLKSLKKSHFRWLRKHGWVYSLDCSWGLPPISPAQAATSNREQRGSGLMGVSFLNFMGVAVARASMANSKVMVSFCILTLEHGQ